MDSESVACRNGEHLACEGCSCECHGDDGPFYCPHGVEVLTPGGACYYCAQEDARDDDYAF